MSKSPAAHYFCDDCLLPFTVYTRQKARRYCPYCGEYLDVKTYKGIHKPTGEKGRKIRWQPEEMALIEEVIKGKKTQMQVAHLLGRSVHSVSKKVARMKEEGCK